MQMKHYLLEILSLQMCKSGLAKKTLLIVWHSIIRYEGVLGNILPNGKFVILEAHQPFGESGLLNDSNP